MHWLLLTVASVLEVCGTSAMKASQGFTRPVPSVLVFVCYGLCFTVFTYALKRIDITIAYAIWSGLGTVLVAIVGSLFFKEPLTPARIVFIGLIVLGVVGLNLNSS